MLIFEFKMKIQICFLHVADRVSMFQSAATRQWRAADGRMIEMDTQQIIRARELRTLYNSVSLTSVSEEQRLWDLMRLKQTVQVTQTLIYP